MYNVLKNQLVNNQKLQSRIYNASFDLLTRPILADLVIFFQVQRGLSALMQKPKG